MKTNYLILSDPVLRGSDLDFDTVRFGSTVSNISPSFRHKSNRAENSKIFVKPKKVELAKRFFSQS